MRPPGLDVGSDLGVGRRGRVAPAPAASLEPRLVASFGYWQRRVATGELSELLWERIALNPQGCGATWARLGCGRRCKEALAVVEARQLDCVRRCGIAARRLSVGRGCDLVLAAASPTLDCGVREPF